MYLGIDYGTSNIGVAISEMGIAIPHRIYEHEEFFAELPELVKKRKITTIVIGEAIGYDAYGKQKKMFQKAIDLIKKTVPDIQIEIQDEDLTTFEAQESL
jgi:putative Holliday junction resolvase